VLHGCNLIKTLHIRQIILLLLEVVLVLDQILVHMQLAAVGRED
jgi:hypothetical protein